MLSITWVFELHRIISRSTCIRTSHTVMKLSFSALALAFLALVTATPLDTRANLQYTGQITHYTPADNPAHPSSCNTLNTEAEAVVALSHLMMKNGPNPNNNPLCGKKIKIFNPTTRGTTQAKIVDTCQSCALEDLDLSPTLFKTVAPKGDGVVSGIQWSFVWGRMSIYARGNTSCSVFAFYLRWTSFLCIFRRTDRFW